MKGYRKLGLTLLTTLLPYTAYAALPATCNDFLLLLGRISNTFAAFIFAIAIIMVLVAAFKFITGGGDASAAGEARQILIWGVVGIAVAMLAFTVPSIVQSFFGGTLLTNCG